jgi:aminopeptidase
MLGSFVFDKLKDKEKRKEPPKITLINSTSESEAEWNRGCVLASAQNFARELEEMPSNLLTPCLFVEAVGERMEGVAGRESLDFIPRPKSWIEEMKMGAFLGVAQGAATSPWLLEMRYNYNPEDTPIVLVGKGVTFDTGGISIKPSAGMGLMRGDMGGAAAVAASVYAVAQLQLPISLVAIIPLCENMLSGTAIKPGDVVTAMNGKTIEVDNTDAEGRLLLADALTYAHSFSPSTIIDLATLTGAIDVALGSGAAAVFTTDDDLWSEIHQAGQVTGDRVWRMPLYQQYTKQIEARTADISNVGARGRGAGACTAAAFLKEFVEVKRWAHLDIAGVMESHGEWPFLDKGMSGRPTRTIVQFLQNSA